MKRVLAATAVAVIVSGGAVFLSNPQIVNASVQTPDKNCSDFQYQEDAQEYFNAQGYSASNDPERLDDANGHGDGIACESLPKRPVNNVQPDDDGVQENWTGEEVYNEEEMSSK